MFENLTDKELFNLMIKLRNSMDKLTRVTFHPHQSCLSEYRTERAAHEASELYQETRELLALRTY
jgi:hypothetical protein